MSEPVGPVPLAGPPKEDPEGLALRARPRPVVRFRRGLVIGLAGAAAAALVAAAWLALEPPDVRLPAAQEGEPFDRGTPRTLADVPGSYGEVPELGPPLPGDLGRAIVAHERTLGGVEPEVARARNAAEDARQRRATEVASARASALFVERRAAETPATPEPASAGNAPEALAIRAPSPWTLAAGTVIAASLVTGLNSDLPGTVIAQVTENVRDSATGRIVVIPQGTRLVGRHDSTVKLGQRRALLMWERLVFPDGSSVELGELPASDRSGYSGVEDHVDAHPWQLIEGIGLATLLGVGTEIGLGDDEGDLVRALREAGQDNAVRAGEQIVARRLDVGPTLIVRPGWPVRAIVNRDLVLRPWGE